MDFVFFIVMFFVSLCGVLVGLEIAIRAIISILSDSATLVYKKKNKRHRPTSDSDKDNNIDDFDDDTDVFEYQLKLVRRLPNKKRGSRLLQNYKNDREIAGEVIRERRRSIDSAYEYLKGSRHSVVEDGNDKLNVNFAEIDRRIKNNLYSNDSNNQDSPTPQTNIVNKDSSEIMYDEDESDKIEIDEEQDDNADLETIVGEAKNQETFDDCEEDDSSEEDDCEEEILSSEEDDYEEEILSSEDEYDEYEEYEEYEEETDEDEDDDENA